MFRLNVASKIVILAVGVVLLTSLFLGTFSYFRQHDEVIKSIEVEKQNEVKILSSHIQSKID